MFPALTYLTTHFASCISISVAKQKAPPKNNFLHLRLPWGFFLDGNWAVGSTLFQVLLSSPNVGRSGAKLSTCTNLQSVHQGITDMFCIYKIVKAVLFIWNLKDVEIESRKGEQLCDTELYF